MIRRIHELAANWVQGWISNFLFGSILIAIPLRLIAGKLPSQMLARLEEYELIIVLGSIAAWWQSLRGSFVPAGSILTGPQRLGMIIEGLGPFAGKNMSLHRLLP